jgi:hypothetical protein
MGIWINDGAYLFFLQARRYSLEYHPSGTKPGDLPRSVQQHFPGFLSGQLKWSLDLGDDWFVTRYTFADE